MPLTAGERLGVYEILALIGKGGMGEVYRARDTRLKRDVALKVLPEAFARDPIRMARFQREAEVLASLNHPNIAAIYGLEGGIEGPALVMEFVEGESPKGPLPFDEAWKIASQIIDGLAYAHDKGVMHQDLKPANIKVTPEGVVKLLDFGLAKAFHEFEDEGSGDPEHSPTISLGKTVPGTILGTPAYMAPEQAQGKKADKRADIWAFGVVLYELLTGGRLFKGEDLSDTLIQVLTKQPDLERVPRKARRLLRECFEKDPRERLRDMGDAKRLLEDEASAPPAPQRKIAVAAIAIVAALALGSVLYLRRPAEEPRVLRFTVSSPGNARFNALNSPAISPDGRRLAFVGGAGDIDQLWVRDLDSLAAHPLPGTEGAGPYPFWSPDSRFLAFFAGGKLKKIDLAGGPVLTLCDAGTGQGGSWSSRDVILFSTSGSGFYEVPAAGGNAKRVTTREKVSGEVSDASFPWFLPDGHHFIYTAVTVGQSSVYIADLNAGGSSKERREILKLQYTASSNANAVYVPPGYLLYQRDRTLMAEPFDADKGQATGDPAPVAEQVDRFSASQNGVLVYAVSAPDVRLTWFDRAGKAAGTVGMPSAINWPAISPDGGRVAHDALDPQGRSVDVWVHDLARGTESRLTFASTVNDFPVWSPDGSRIAFRSNAVSKFSLIQRAINGGREEVLDDINLDRRPDDWSRDGRYIIEEVTDPKTNRDIWVLPFTDGKPGKPFPYLQTPFNESYAKLSPNGKWLAYTSDETNRNEVYVQEFTPSPSGISSGGEVQISTNGGSRPIWSRDGRELFFMGADQKMMAVDIKSGAKFDPGAPKALFETHISGSIDYWFDVAKDGRFLIPVRSEQAASEPMTVVVNWTAGLKR